MSSSAAMLAKEAKPAAKTAKMHFILCGFKQDVTSRVYSFEGLAPDRNPVACTVRADLALSRRYGIPIQELPLLCRSLLERRGPDGISQAIVFTEEEMRSCASARAAKDEAAKKRRPARRHSSANLGAAWRTPHIY